MYNLIKNISFKLIIIFFILFIIGFAIYPLLTIKLSPTLNFPSIYVSYSWFNATPKILEQEVTSKLEAGISTLEFVKEIKSKSNYHSGYIDITIDKTIDIDYARYRVATIIKQLYAKLPENVSYPQIFLNNPDDEQINTPMLIYSINAKDEAYNIQKCVNEKIKPLIAKIHNVKQVNVYGGIPYEWVFDVNLKQLNLYKIKVADILIAVEQYFDKKDLGLSMHKTNNKQIAVKINNCSFNQHIIWNNIPIGKYQNRIIYLKDIANINQNKQPKQTIYRINGKEAVYLNVYQEKNANTIVLANRIKTAISTKAILPSGYNLVCHYDSAIYIKKEIEKILYRSIFSILFLLIFIWVINKSFKYLLVIFSGLILNIFTAFIFYHLFKIQIHIYSLAGITISLGIIIDNFIVTIEHVKKHNNIKVFPAVLSSTLTTIAALSVIMFLDDFTKMSLFDFAMVIIINLCISLLVSIFYVIALAHRFNILHYKNNNISYKRKKRIIKISKGYSKLLYLFLKRKIIIIFIAVLIFGTPIYMLPNQLDKKYWAADFYNITLGNKWFVENIKPTLAKYTGGTLRLFALYVFNDSYYSNAKETILNISLSAPYGTTINQTDEIVKQIEKKLSNYTGISIIETNIYSARNAKITVKFNEKYQKSTLPFICRDDITKFALNFSGMAWNIFGVGKGFSTHLGGTMPEHYYLSVYGYNYDELTHIINKLNEKLLTHPRINKTTIIEGKEFWQDNDTREYKIKLNNKKLINLNLTPIQVFNYLNKIAINNTPDMFLLLNNEHKYIKIKASNEIDLFNLSNLPMNFNQDIIKLKDIADIKLDYVNNAIIKENQEYIRTVKFNYLGMGKFANKYLDSLLPNFNKSLPIGYYVKKEDSYWYIFSNDKKENNLYLIIFVFILIYLICAIVFESLKQPFVVILLIPLSFIGVFITFYLFKLNFDQGGYAAFLLLTGITVNASLYIINEYSLIKNKNNTISQNRLFIKAMQNKLTPILLTIFSTIAGLLPFIFYGQKEPFWFVLAVATVAGLLMSVIVLIVILPILMLTKK